jgi:hypothetical protein
LISLTIYSIWSVAKCITSDYNRIDVRKVLLKLTLVVLLCALFLAPSLMSNKAFGSILLAQQARLMPEAGEGGRYKLVPLPEISTVIKENFTILTQTSGDSPLPFLKLLTQKSHGAPLYIIMCIALLFSLMGIMRPPYMALTIALTGIVLFFVACFLAFRLFLPERMIMYTLPVAVIYLLSTTFTGIRHTISEGVLRRVSSIVLLLVFIVFFGIAFKGPIGLNVNTHSQEGLFRILKTLPEPALFAGHPKRMNNIPLWAQRAVLVNLETSQIFYDKAWNEIKERTYDNFNAYYASSPEPVKVLREKYGVDYMLIHEQDVSPFYTKGCDYFEPFTTWVRRLCQKPSKDLIWKKAAPSSIVGQASRFKVINLEIFLKQF